MERETRNFRTIEKEEDHILFNLHKAAAKKGRTVLSLRASAIVDFSSQYGSNNVLAYNAENIVGRPNVYPLSGDNQHSYHPRTYGRWWEMSPSYLKSKLILPSTIPFESQDFVEFRVVNPVAPRLLRVYEVYNPGAIIKVLCFCYETGQWVVLWQGKPQMLSSEQSHCFTIKIEDVEFMTNLYRLEFHHKHLDYYCEIDGLALYGESKSCCIFPTSQNRSSVNCASNNEMEIEEEFQSSDCMSRLPSEVSSVIFSFLDLRSLCTISRTSRVFKKICYDPALYKDLNLQPYWHLVDDEALMSLESRLRLMKKLNLSWCGGQNRITPYFFIQFVEDNCQNLTTLRLANCSFVNDDCLRAIAKYCPSLKELDIQCCRSEDLYQSGFKCIARMSNLVYLNLYRTKIDDLALNVIIKSLKLKHLSINGCSSVKNIRDIVVAISKHLGSSLISLNLSRRTDLECQAVRALSLCTNLEELDLCGCREIKASCGCVRTIIESCPKLKALFLSAIRSISNSDLDAIVTCCPNMELLDILGSKEYNLAGVKNLLQNCRKLKLLDISYSSAEVRQSVPYLRALFPSVSIKYSFPRNRTGGP